MSNREVDDYQSDIRFGEWMRGKRTEAKLSLEAAAQASALSVERLKSLELGYAERGITRAEATQLCAIYRLEISEFLKRAEHS